MIRATFGSLPIGTVFFRRSKFWKKKRLFQGFASEGYPQSGGVWLQNGSVITSCSSKTTVWIDPDECDGLG